MIRARRDKNFQKRIFLWGLLISFSIYGFCSSVALQKPFNLDEADFTSLAHNIKLSGRPILYVAEDFVKDLCNLKLYSAEQHLGYGLWHPPLYGNLLALWFKIFGETTLAGRLFGLFCAIISLFLCLIIIKEICTYENINKEDRFFISVLASILYFINPLILQFSLLIDIDNSIQPILILLFFYIFIKNYRNDKLRFDIYLGLIFGISLLAKLPTPPLVLISIFVFYLFERKIGKAFKKTFIIGFVGIIFFLLIWLTYAISLSLPVNFFLVYNYGTKVLPILKYKALFLLPLIKNTSIFFVSWVSPAFIILAIIGMGDKLLNFIRTKKLSPLILLIIFSLVVWCAYTIFYPRGSMMKYQFINYQIFIVIISFLIFKYLKNLTMKELIISFIGGAIFLLFMFFRVPDSVMLSYNFLSKRAMISTIIFYLLPTFILPFGLSFLFSGTLKTKYLILGFFVALLVYNISLDFKQVAPYTTTNDWNNYGELGLKETIDYLDKNLSSEGTIICRKDVGYYLKEMKNRPKRKWYSNDNCFNLPFHEATDFFQKIIKKDDIQYIELDRQAVRTSYLPKAVFDYYSPDKQIGDFLILRRNK
jgi:4-amino-4-deoxy-L-arabinose transferase-like glycosyltransferase